METRRRLDTIIRFEIIVFALAALVHGGAFVAGYEHREARIAEAVIAVVLLVGLLVAGLRPRHAPLAIVLAQGFALLGTLVGAAMILLGVGPRTVPDVVYHLVMLAVLAWGMRLALRWRATAISPG